MAKPRKELHQILKEILGSNYVYFQPPESVKLNYPCIIYHRSGSKNLHADDVLYRNLKKYDLIVIDKNPDSKIPDEIEKLRYCSLGKVYTADNLNHYSFTIFF